MTRHLFFLLCFKFFSHGNSVGIYRGNISVGKIPRKFTDENIPSVFPFVFINFLVMDPHLWKGFLLRIFQMKKNLKMSRWITLSLKMTMNSHPSLLRLRPPLYHLQSLAVLSLTRQKSKQQVNLTLLPQLMVDGMICSPLTETHPFALNPCISQTIMLFCDVPS